MYIQKVQIQTHSDPTFVRKAYFLFEHNHRVSVIYTTYMFFGFQTLQYSSLICSPCPLVSKLNTLLAQFQTVQYLDKKNCSKMERPKAQTELNCSDFGQLGPFRHFTVRTFKRTLKLNCYQLIWPNDLDFKDPVSSQIRIFFVLQRVRVKNLEIFRIEKLIQRIWFGHQKKLVIEIP